MKKSFYPWKILIILINDKSGGINDGLILYQKKKPYSSNDAQIFKLKPQHLKTSDLFLHKQNSQLFLCIIKLSRGVVNWNQVSELQGVGEAFFGSNIKLYQLYMPGYGDIGITTIDDCVFEDEDIKDVIKKSENCNFVVECLWVVKTSQWKILRFRPSKKMPNAHKVVLDNFNLSGLAIDKNSFYSSTNSFYKYEDDDSYKRFNAYASHCTSFQISYWLGKNKGGLNYHKTMPTFHVFEDVFEDVACGRGGRLNNINDLSIKTKLIFTDVSNQSLDELTSRISSYSQKRSGASLLLNDVMSKTARNRINHPYNHNFDNLKIIAHNQYGIPIYNSELHDNDSNLNVINNSSTNQLQKLNQAQKIKLNKNDYAFRFAGDDLKDESKLNLDDNLDHVSDESVRKVSSNRLYLNPISNIKNIRIKQLDLTIMSDVVHEINDRGDEKVDAYIMIYSVFYMFAHERAFESFSKYLNALSSPNALFFVNLIDVELALNMKLTRFKVMPIDNHNLKLPFNNMFNFSIPFKSDTPGQLVYNEEPGIASDILIAQMKKIGWKLLGSNPMHLINGTKDHVQIKIKLDNDDDKKWRNAHITFCFAKESKKF